MKQKLFIFCFALLCSANILAHDFEVDGFYYNYLGGDSVAVTYQGSSAEESNEYQGSIVIPREVYDGTSTYRVTTINPDAFAYCESLTSIDIPNSVTSIGYAAFQYCKGLTSIILPNSVVTLANAAFWQCSNLSSVTLSNALTTIGSNVFERTNLTSIYIPKSVVSIESPMMSDCPNLESIIVEDGNPTYYSVNNCLIDRERKALITGCKNSIIPTDGSVTILEDYAFYGATGLRILTISDKITSIGSSTFYACSNLETIIVDDGNFTYHSTGNCLIETATNTLILGCKNSIIPTDGSVTKIGENAFGQCVSLTSITIPYIVTEIGDWAFVGTGLTTINISDNIQRIGDGAFDGCPLSYNKANNLYYLGNSNNPYHALITYDWNYSSSEITSIDIHDQTKIIAGRAFYWAENLTSVTIPEGVKTIGSEAFSECHNLSSVTLPSTLTTIEDRAFSGCAKLTSIILPDNLTTIGFVAFSSTGLMSVIVPRNISVMGERAFGYCDNLTSVTWNVEQCNDFNSWLGSSPFEGSPIATLTFGEDVKRIPASLCYYSSTIESIHIPNNTTSIGNYAFYRCSNLKSIQIPDKITSIEEYAFYNCSNLNSITIDALTPPNLQSTNSFRHIADDATITVPCEALADYRTSPFWTDLNVTAPFDYTITVKSDNNEQGTVTITQQPDCASDAIFKAIGNIGYQFKEWNDGNTDNPRTVTVTEDCIFTASFEQANIVYELNGGVTNEFGWTCPQDMYATLNADWNAFMDTTTTWTPLAKLTDFTKGIPTEASNMQRTFLENETLQMHFQWLIEYMDAKCTEAGLTLPTENDTFWRYNLAAFFLDTTRSVWPRVPDYRIYGVSNYASYKDYWKSAFANPTNPTETFTLNEPYREGYVFLGWYDNAEFAGEPITVVDASTQATLYAKWGNSTCLTYTILGGDSVSVAAINQTDCAGIVAIPATTKIDGVTYRVTTICEYAFRGCEELTTIEIPNSITSIEGGAFYYCTKLGSVVIPNSVIQLSSEAFWRCYSLKSVTLSNSITNLSSFVFSECTQLSSIVIPASITEINVQALNNCSNLESITVEDGNTVYYSKDNCLIHKESKTLVLGCKNSLIPADGSVVAIGDRAFEGCSGLTSIFINEHIQSIGRQAFASCSGLETIEVDPSNTVYHSNENCLIETATHTLIAGCKNSIIPSNGSVTTIGNYAFGGCTGLTSIIIPECITEIGEMPFYDCSNLEYNIYEGMRYLGNENNQYHALINRGNAWDVETPIIHPQTKLIAGFAFEACNLRSITIPENVTFIGNYAFFYCQNLSEITIPNNVTDMGIGVFQQCTVLQSITLSENLTKIENSLFEYCSSLSSIIIPEKVKHIGRAAFAGCVNLLSISGGENLETIADYAFYNCSVLESVHLGQGLVSLGGMAFESCTNLTSVTIDAIIPPSVHWDSFNSQVNITVPCEALANYLAIPAWQQYTLISPFEYTLTVLSANEEQGTVNITQYPDCASDAIFEAIANTGYRFKEWNDGNTDNPRSVTVSEDVTYTAIFETQPLLEKIILTPRDTTIRLGESFYLGASIYPTDGYYEGLYYRSSNPEVADMDNADWWIYPHGVGETTIYIYTENPYVIDSCHVRVIQPVESVGIEYYHSDMFVGEQFQLSAYIYPDNATIKDVTWESSNPECLSVSETGLLTAHEAGQAIITVTTKDGGYTASCEISVEPAITSLELYVTSLTMHPDEMYYLNLKTDPQDATKYRLEWESDNEDVAFSDGGLVVACQPGTATITVRTPDGLLSASCIVKVVNFGDDMSYDVVINPSDESADFSWPAVENASSYIFVIYADAAQTEKICTLTFDANGYLTRIDFMKKKPAAARDSQRGFNFVVTGLEPNTTYGYTLDSYNDDSILIDRKTGQFTTTDQTTTSIDNSWVNGELNVHKVLEDGIIYIVKPNGKRYTIDGRLVK